MKNDYVISLVEKKYADPFIMPYKLIPIAESMNKGQLHDKLKKIFDYFQDNIAYSSDYPRQRNSLDVFNEKKGNCIEQSFLFVTMARFLGFNSRVAFVSKDNEGDKVNHACSAVDYKDGYVLIDTTYHKFDINHQQYNIVDDDEVRKYRCSYVEKKKINGATLHTYNLGDLIQYLYDFQYMPFRFSQKGCFYDNVDTLSRHVSFLRLKEPVLDLGFIKDKAKIFSKIKPLDDNLAKKVDDRTAYDVGKYVRMIKDLKFTKKNKKVVTVLHRLKEILPTYLGNDYDVKRINDQILALQDKKVSSDGVVSLAIDFDNWFLKHI